ncbi:MAG: hypothetical protein LBK18_10040 [Prevotellaceae bacterium]|jgi:Spy/CpxP family protein refolding chaperone|nr:hypothetical protein [Prevotellaceae bacterium]
MKKTLILFIASAVAFSAVAEHSDAEHPDAERAEKKETHEWLIANNDSVGKQRHEQAQVRKKQAQEHKEQAQVRRADSDSTKQQQRRQRHEQMQARKVGYFTAQLELTPDEAALFWPVYNEYWKKRDDFFNERNNLMRKAKHDKMDDKKALQVAQRMIDCLQDDANLMREYNEKFAKVLPPQKLLKYYIAEESFKVELLNVLRKHGDKVEN